MTYLKVSENPKTMEVPRTVPRVKSVHHLTVIEWEMLDKKKFFPLSMMSSFTVRCFLLSSDTHQNQTSGKDTEI